MTTIERVCSCGKPYTKRRAKDSNKCPDCITADLVEWRKNNPEKCRSYAKKGKAGMVLRDPEKIKKKAREAAARHRQRMTEGKAPLRAVLALLLWRAEKGIAARKREVPVVDLTIDDLIEIWHKQQGKCAISGMEMMANRKHLKSVSLDRRASSGPYSKENVQLVCRWANFAKNSHTDEEIKAVLAELLSPRRTSPSSPDPGRAGRW